MKGHRIHQLGTLAESACNWLIWLSCLAFGFYGLWSRTSRKIYSEPLMYALSPCDRPALWRYCWKLFLFKVLWPYCVLCVKRNSISKTFFTIIWWALKLSSNNSFTCYKLRLNNWITFSIVSFEKVFGEEKNHWSQRSFI